MKELPAWPTERAPSFQDSPSAHVAYQCAMKEAYAARLRELHGKVTDVLREYDECATYSSRINVVWVMGELREALALIGPLPEQQETAEVAQTPEVAQL